MTSHTRPNNTNHSAKIAERLLGDLELAIMRVAWTRESVSVRDVWEVLRKQRPLAYTTVMTVMGRLAQKGLLAVERTGKTYRYRAAQTSEEFEAQAARKVVQSLIEDFGDELAIRQFVQQLSEASPAQLAQLAELARQAQEEEDE